MRLETKQAVFFSLIVIAAIIFIAFSGTLQNDFIGWDDNYYVLNSPFLLPLSPGLIKRIFTSFYFASYSPLSLLSHTLDYNMWGMDPRGHHLTNIVLHTANGCLVFLLSLGIYRRSRRVEEGEGRESRESAYIVGAGFAALLFALHPLRVESIACVSSRKDLLSALFLITAALAYLKDERKRGSWSWRPWFLLSLGSYLLALLAKGSGMSFAGVLLMLDLMLDGGWVSWRRGLVLVREKVPFLLLGVGAAVIAYVASEVAGTTDIGVKMVPVVNRWETGFSTIVFYAVKSFWPAGIAELYLLSFDWRATAAVFVVLAVTAATVYAFVRFRRPGPLCIWGSYLAAILPMAGFVPSSIQLISNRYAYITTLPFAIGVGYALVAAMCFAPRRRESAWVSVGAAGIVVAVLGLLSVRQIPNWRSAEAVWRTSIEVTPGHYTSYFNLGNEFQSRQEIDSAIAYFRLALKVAPNSERSLVALGGAYALKKDTSRAEIIFQAVREKLPRYGAVYLGLGSIREMQGRFVEADSLYAVAEGLDPANAIPLFNRAVVALRMGHEQDAVGHLVRSLQVNPNFPNGHFLLGRIRMSRPATRLEGEALIRRAAELGSLDAQKVLLGLGGE
jgi:protein O-mannosyl-transferase